jgi:hypothetical protein
MAWSGKNADSETPNSSLLPPNSSFLTPLFLRYDGSMRFATGLLILLSVFCSCSPRAERAQGNAVSDSFKAVPLALIEAGENPLWFELGGEGPRQIAFPDEAGLSPFAPWPLARHIRFIYPWEKLLVLGINRDGFLLFAPPEAGNLAFDGGLAVYRFADPAYWGQYSLAALFPFGEYLGALLYRDDFFAGPAAPIPSPRIFAIRPDSPEAPEPQPLGLSAFDGFSPEEGWDIEALRFGHDGRWYYRGARKNAEAPKIVYYRTETLTRQGEAVSSGAFQNSVLPEPASAAPTPLRSVLEAAFAQSPGGGLATVVFPGSRGPRYFSGSGGAAAPGGGSGGPAAGAEAGGSEIAGFYREPTTDRPGAALAIFPDGRGFFCADGGGSAVPVGPAAEIAAPAGVAAPAGKAAASAGETAPAGPSSAGIATSAGPRPLSLPVLPPGFVYTAIAPCGDALIAAWEEQEGYSIGAAGFMVIRVTAH